MTFKTKIEQKVDDIVEDGLSADDEIEIADAEDIDGESYGYVHGVQLTKKQCDFVHWYSLLGNATLAARKAGYGPRANRNNMSVIGHQLLRNPVIATALQRVWFERRERFHATEDAVISMLMKAYTLAETDRDARSMVQAVKVIAAVNGYLDRFRAKSQFGAVSDEQIAQDARAVLTKLGQRADIGTLKALMVSRKPIEIEVDSND